MKEVIYFDLDDTLYERSWPFQVACWKCFGLPMDECTLWAYQACAARGEEVFEDSQKGRITMEEMYIYRCTKGFGDVGIRITPEEALTFTKIYKEAQAEIKLDPRVAGVLDACKAKYPRMGIISNGPGRNQRVKVEALGLENWMEPELLLISGELGVDKPDEKIFQIAEEKADAQCMMVGDSYENDILPAKARGWKTIWLNKHGKQLGDQEPKPDVELSRIGDLINYI